jgi:hypothetical protein
MSKTFPDPTTEMGETCFFKDFYSPGKAFLIFQDFSRLPYLCGNPEYKTRNLFWSGLHKHTLLL